MTASLEIPFPLPSLDVCKEMEIQYSVLTFDWLDTHLAHVEQLTPLRLPQY